MKSQVQMAMMIDGLKFHRNINDEMVATFVKPKDYLDGETELVVNDLVVASQEGDSEFYNYELDSLMVENFEDSIVFTLDEDEYDKNNRYRLFYNFKH